MAFNFLRPRSSVSREQQASQPAQNPALWKRVLKIGTLTAFAMAAALAEKPARPEADPPVAAAHDAETDDAHALVEEAWEDGFEERNGPELLEVMQEAQETNDDTKLQEFIDDIPNIEDAVFTADAIVDGCMEDRLTVCRCGIGGSGILIENNGEVQVPTPREMAINILMSPAVANSMKPIVIVEHEECGANRLALAAIRGVQPDTLSQEEVDAFGRERGMEVVAELTKLLEEQGITREVRFLDVRIGTPEMPGPSGAHPAQMMLVTNFPKGDRVVNPEFPGLPQAMQLNPTAFADEGDFILHLQTGIKILIGEHGSGHTPVIILGLTEEEAAREEVKALIERAIADLPEEIRSKVVIGAAAIEELQEEDRAKVMKSLQDKMGPAKTTVVP